MIDERERAKSRKRAMKYRETVCRGCRNNRYNYESAGDGWDAPTTGDGCWFLDEIERGKCRMWSR